MAQFKIFFQPWYEVSGFLACPFGVILVAKEHVDNTTSLHNDSLWKLRPERENSADSFGGHGQWPECFVWRWDRGFEGCMRVIYIKATKDISCKEWPGVILP